ncbi:MAG: hypothetical protein ACR2RL_12740 [Gammaproteobacteria bacterium]
MLLIGSSSRALPSRTVSVHGQPYMLREYIGAAPRHGTYVDGNEANDNALAQGFLVTQPPGSVTRPHFHETHQFQVFVAGSGRFGKKPALPITVQYASGHTPYGPIAAGDDGVQYFTLRQRWDPGAKYMPAMRDRLIRGRQRQHLVSGIAVSEPSVLRARTGVTLESFIGPESDGLLGAIIRLGPGAEIAAPDSSSGGGQYHVVVNGSLMHGSQPLPLWSCQFADTGEGELGVRAGEQGLELLVLRFPID